MPSPLPKLEPPPVVVVDTREQTPLPFARLATIRAGLYSGDYGVAGLDGLFAVERKSVADLVGCCCGSNRDRFENELHRLRGYRFRRLLIVGNQSEIEGGAYRSRVSPASVFGTLAMIEARYDCPVVFASTPTIGGELVEGWACYFAREYMNRAADFIKATAYSGHGYSPA